MQKQKKHSVQMISVVPSKTIQIVLFYCITSYLTYALPRVIFFFKKPLGMQAIF
jgi:hypothetical protein